MGSAFAFVANSYVPHKLLLENPLPALRMCFCLGAQKSRVVPPCLLLSIAAWGAAWTREMLDVGALEDQASHVNARRWLGDVSGELQKRDGAGQSRQRGWGLVLWLFPRCFGNFPNAWGLLPFVLSYFYTATLVQIRCSQWSLLPVELKLIQIWCLLLSYR